MNPARRMAELQAALRDGLAHQAAGALDDAAAAYRRALAVLPRCADALHLLAQTRHLQRRDAEALDLVRRAIAAAAPTAMYENTRGAILRATGRASEALAAFRRAVAIDPRHPASRKNLAAELARVQPDGEETIQAFVLACALQPRDAECWLGLSQALAAAGRVDEAMAAAARSATFDPARGVAYDAWFAAAQQCGRLADFVDAMAAISVSGPGHLERGLRLVDGLLALARNDEALRVAEDCVAVHPGEPRSIEKLATVQEARGDLAAAAQSFARVLELAGEREFAAIGLAKCRMGAGMLEAAEAAYASVVARHPASQAGWNGRAVVLARMDRDAEAVSGFDRAIELAPGCALTRSNRAISLLRLGRLGAAWSDYLWRDTTVRPMPVARWPADLAGRRIHVTAEQGIGDHLFFLRFVPAIVGRGATVTVEADARLAAMLGRAGFTVATSPPDGSESAAMGDMPWLLGCGDEDLPPPVALPVDARPAAVVAAMLAGLPRPIVCATWRAGGQKGRKDSTKLVAPAALGAALRGLPGTVVSVQRAARAGEHAEFEAALGRAVPDLGALNEDLEKMLALMAAADGYAGVSNANLHLRCGTGAAGSDILATIPLDWRWRTDSGGRLPWFPGCTSYRQAPDGSWDEALARLRATLGARFG